MIRLAYKNFKLFSVIAEVVSPTDTINNLPTNVLRVNRIHYDRTLGLFG